MRQPIALTARGGRAAVFALLLATVALAALPAIAADDAGDSGSEEAEDTDDGGPELVVNPAFEDGAAPWWGTPNLLGDDGDEGDEAALEEALEEVVDEGTMCVEVPAGTAQPWDVIIGQDDLPVVEGQDYIFSFTASGSLPRVSRSLVQMPHDPWTAYLTLTPTLGDEPTTYVDGFTAPETREDAQIVFQVGGSDEPWTFCLHDVSLVQGTIEPYEPETGPRVRVNQAGYLPAGPKRATLVTAASEPVAWQLQDADGAVVADGLTTPAGHDETADLDVHTIDLGEVEAQGEAFTLVADGETSYPFPIDDGIYAPLVADAMSFFYPQRSGVEILGEVAGEDYARPAGHASESDGDATNPGDIGVPCLPGEEAIAQYGRAVMSDYGDAWPCAYDLDVVGGWYDAGDHGKYVVNGGISVFALQSAYERTLAVPGVDASVLGDGTLRIPEADNGIPDVLDESRWQLEFLLKMQVPDGEPFEGMAHHKIHDLRWTGLPTYPHEDDQPRYLHPPTTAATLNLAAAAAQAARLWEGLDDGFADELLDAAERAWDAAQDHPELLAPEPSHDNPGGGPYDDAILTDEFYWAASQLYLTTGEQRYLDAVMDNPRHEAAPNQIFRASGAFDWQSTAGAARLSLALVDSDLPDRDRVRGSVVEAADAYLASQAEQPFGHPYAPANGYAWGSNHLLVNNLIVIAAAHEVTGDPRYRDGVLEGLDYLFGRNALNLTYVTGWGEVDVRNQHSRWYANQLDPTSPNPPPGSLSGGPNSTADDPVAQRLLKDCADQTCFVDDIESWATNEITINWNASLSWLASMVAAPAEAAAASEPADGEQPAATDAVGDEEGAARWAIVALVVLVALAVVASGAVVWRRRTAPAGG